MRRSEGDFVRSSPYRRARRSGPALVTAAAIEDAVDCGSSSVSGTGVWKRAPAGEKVPSLLNLAPLRGQVLGCGDEAVAATRQQTWWFRPSIRLDGACSGASEGPVKLGLSDLGATILNLDDDASDLGGSDVYWYSLFPFSGACWVCRGMPVLSGLLFLASSARLRWRWCRGITSSDLFLAPVTFCSGINGEVAEILLGVFGWRLIVLTGVFWPFARRLCDICDVVVVVCVGRRCAQIQD
ncbi:hypothetical protein ZEAMMB73_Zm00001d031244 [Zea mays]|uniref:Uncharacterized protein n=1 Tax=Zea mays TaxID=4577 RepID=A0A1D6KHK9_MAIZE|nr:hypothetical protein ZEAMMB73_Zm00001d031244 [Zea mays]